MERRRVANTNVQRHIRRVERVAHRMICMQRKREHAGIAHRYTAGIAASSLKLDSAVELIRQAEVELTHSQAITPAGGCARAARINFDAIPSFRCVLATANDVTWPN